MKMFVIEDNSVAKVFDDFSKEEYFNNRNNIRQFSSTEAQDYLKDNGYEASEKLQAIVFADGCDCCKDYFTIHDWGWESEDAKDLTKNDYEYFDKIIHAYDNNIKVTDWCPGTTIDGDTLNFCEDCYTRYDDIGLGIVDENTGIQGIFKDIKNNVIEGLSSLNKNLILDENNIEYISLAIKRLLRDKVAYELSPYSTNADISKLNLDNKDIFNIASKVYATNYSLSVNEEHSVYSIIEDAFKKIGITIEPLGDKITDFRPLMDDFENKLFTALSSDDNYIRGRVREVIEPVVILGKFAETTEQAAEYRKKAGIIDKLAESMGETKLVDSVWQDCMNKCHSKPVQQTDTPKTYLSEAMTDAIKALKEKGLSLPEIGKAFNEASKEVLVQLGKENLANKGR